MINLLPEERKKQLKAARANTSLIRYVIFLGFSMLFLFGIYSVSKMILSDSKASAEQLIESNAAKSGSYQALLQQATSINASLSSAKSLLSGQSTVSDLLIKIGSAMPGGVVLDGITLTSVIDNAGINLVFRSNSPDKKDILLSNMKKIPELKSFSVVSEETDETNVSYPYVINANLKTIRAN